MKLASRSRVRDVTWKCIRCVTNGEHEVPICNAPDNTGRIPRKKSRYMTENKTLLLLHNSSLSFRRHMYIQSISTS